MYRTDLAFLAVFLVVSLAIIWLTPGFPDTGERFGPAFLPRVLAVLLLSLTAALLVNWLRAAGRARLATIQLPTGFSRRAGLFAVAIAGYVGLLSRETPLGFPGLTLVFVAATAPLFGGRSAFRVAGVAVAITLSLYLVFRVWLNVPLPRSAWF